MPIAVKEVSLRNILSFGPQGSKIGLANLNVLIGPNGSGKSNLIEVFALLRSSPASLYARKRRGKRMDLEGSIQRGCIDWSGHELSPGGAAPEAFIGVSF